MIHDLHEMLADALAMTRNERHRCAAVFTQPNCIWCDRVKALLIDNDYAVREFSIGDLPDEQSDAFALRFKTVPQVIINGAVIGGFAEVHEFFHAESPAPDLGEQIWRRGVWS